MSEPAKSLNKKAQGEETRAILIAVGARLFALHGFHGVSMRKLASESEVNLATVGYHFGGKAGLYEAILREIFNVRDTLFPSVEETRAKVAQAGNDPHKLADVVSWYVHWMVTGLLDTEENFWPAFLISREFAQPTQQYKALEQEFFDPVFESLMTLVCAALPESADREEQIIAAHCMIGMVVKFLEGAELINRRLEWKSYKGRGTEKIAEVLGKRMRGFFGLPMESK